MGGSFGKKKSKIIIVGLDNSGKSTMINMLKPKRVSLETNVPDYSISENYKKHCISFLDEREPTPIGLLSSLKKFSQVSL